MILEEYIMKDKIPQHPFYIMGCEGLWGILFTTILFTTAGLYACPVVESQCINGHLDDYGILRDQIKARPILIAQGLMFMLCCSFYNGASLLAVKYASAVHRNIAEQM